MKRIKLTQGKCAIVDDEDYEWLNKHKWQLHVSGKLGNRKYYAKRAKENTSSKAMRMMHREILDLGTMKEDVIQVDHINGDGLDNRKTNLRIASPSQNQANNKNRGGFSIYKGVSKKGNRWQAKIGFNKKQVYLGLFKTEKEAAESYNNAAISYYGEYARINNTGANNG